MSLLTPEQTVQLIKNGHNPEADHVPVVLLEAMHEGDILMSFMLTHVEPDHPNQAYGLVDLGHGRPHLSLVFLNVLQKSDPRFDYAIEVAPDFVPEYPVSVYAEAARMMQKMTLNASALRMAANRIEILQQREPVKSPFRDHHGGPAFLPFPN